MKPLLSLVAGVFVVVSAIPLAGAVEPTGASLAFTSKDRVVSKARAMMQTGNFKEAEVLLAAPDEKANSETLKAREETAEILRRLRIEYSLDLDALVEKIKKSIPDAAADDVERWATESRARFRIIDGKKFFFRREPSNIFLFSREAKERRAKAGNAPKKPEWKLTSHLQAVIDEAERTGATHVQPVKHRVTHTLTIRSNNPAVKNGSIVRVWLPYPQDYRQQKDVKFISATPSPTLIAPTFVESNTVSGAPQRTVYFEVKVTDPSKPLSFSEVFEYVSFAYYPVLDEAQVRPLPAGWNGTCLGERPPHIVFTPAIREEVARIVKGKANSFAKAKAIFHWVSANIPWNAEDEYCIIPSFVLKGFTEKRGDCGVQNTVFITMCRIAGIPARWQSGFETKPGQWGMHDWAEIYIAPWGWLPADASYGVQESDDPKVADFYCGHQDSYRMIVNLDWGRELVPPKASFRSEPADFQRGEVEVDGKNLYFDEWDYETDVERELLGS